MSNKIKSLLKIPSLFLLVSLFLIQCTEKESTAVPLDSIDTKLTANTDLSILKAAIIQAKLETFTKGPGPFTLFAPTNAALTASGITVASLTTIDSVALTAFLLNHMQNIKRTSFEIPDGPNAPMASLAGFSNFGYKDKAADKIFINGATITSKDVTCSNGTIHIIDKTLFAPAFSISTLLSTNSTYKLMVQAITKTALTATFSPAAGSPATIFALDNATMTANGYDSTAIANLSPAGITTLSNILKYHVIQSRNFSVALKAGNLKTALGTNVIVSLGMPVSIKGASNTAAFPLVFIDVIATNGVIHTIGGMLKP